MLLSRRPKSAAADTVCAIQIADRSDGCRRRGSAQRILGNRSHASNRTDWSLDCGGRYDSPELGNVLWLALGRDWRMMELPRVGQGAVAGQCIRVHGAARRQMNLRRKRRDFQGESERTFHLYARLVIILVRRNCCEEGCVGFATLPHLAARSLAFRVRAVHCDYFIKHTATFAYRHYLLRFVAHQRRCKATCGHSALKFPGRKASLGVAGQVHRRKLGVQGQLCALKDCAGDQRIMGLVAVTAKHIACSMRNFQMGGAVTSLGSEAPGASARARAPARDALLYRSLGEILASAGWAGIGFGSTA